jgi:phenylacetate-CoA ligase
VLIRSQTDLNRLQEAAREASRHDGTIPGPEFYATKLEKTWARARDTAAYAHLGPFSIQAIHRLQVTPKANLRKEPWQFTRVPLDRAAKYYETTGTADRPTPTPRTVEDIVWNVAAVSQAWAHLIGPGDRVAITMPSDVVPVGDLIAHVCELLGVVHTRIYPFAAGVCDWGRMLEVVSVLRPTVVFVAPGVALQLTRVLKGRGALTEVAASVHRLLLLGEVSTPALRRRLGDWWNADVYDASYGSTETGTIAASCQHGRLHLLMASHLVEVDPGSGPVAIDQARRGRLVVTPLNLHSRALLRYETGDDVVLDRDCPCGRATPTIQVQGRASDELELQGRRITPATVEELVFNLPGITGFQIVLGGDGASLVLERDVDADREREPVTLRTVTEDSRAALGVEWADVIIVNRLPSITNSGASQKSWKRSHVVVAGTGR